MTTRDRWLEAASKAFNDSDATLDTDKQVLEVQRGILAALIALAQSRPEGT